MRNAVSDTSAHLSALVKCDLEAVACRSEAMLVGWDQTFLHTYQQTCRLMWEAGSAGEGAGGGQVCTGAEGGSQRGYGREGAQEAGSPAVSTSPRSRSVAHHVEPWNMWQGKADPQ